VLDDLTIDSFSGRIGQRFGLDDNGASHDLELVECERLGRTALEREPFSLVFLGPREPVLPQRIYPLAHDELGELEIFLVPIAQDADGVRYEAVFT
jgi:hypothetical protein